MEQLGHGFGELVVVVVVLELHVCMLVVVVVALGMLMDQQLVPKLERMQQQRMLGLPMLRMIPKLEQPKLERMLRPKLGRMLEHMMLMVGMKLVPMRRMKLIDRKPF